VGTGCAGGFHTPVREGSIPSAATMEKKNLGWWLAWVLAPTIVIGGSTVVALKGGVPGLVTGVATIIGAAWVLWRKFGK
jgi:hypothetical protein